MHSDQMHSDLSPYYNFVANYVIIRACIMDSEMPYFLVWSLCIKRLVHLAVHCIILSYLLSFLCNPYIPFLIYEIFHLLVDIAVIILLIHCYILHVDGCEKSKDSCV